MAGPRGPAKITDYEWRATIVYTFSTFLIPIWICTVSGYRIIKAITDSTAPTALEASETLPDAYGFWVRGNTSFFNPEVMGRTDMNSSSATHLHWVPPPEWRDYCIASSGMPISACSYFQYEESPTFMTIFWVLMPLLQAYAILARVIVAMEGLAAVHLICKTAIKKDGAAAGISQLSTPWGMEKSPYVHQACCFKVGFALCSFYLFNTGRIIMSYISAYTEPGFGLVHSVGTGKLYLGALWNHFPLPAETRFSNIPLYWTQWIKGLILSPGWLDLSGSDFWGWNLWKQGSYMTPLSYSFLANDIHFDLILTMFTMLMKLLFIVYVDFMSAKAEKGAKYVGGAKRLFGYPDDLTSFASWKFLWMEEEFTGRTVYPFFLISCCFSIHTLSRYEITAPGYAETGDDGMVRWLRFTHATMVPVALAIAGYLFFSNVINFPKLKRRIEATKHMMTAEIYKTQFKSLLRKQRMFTTFFVGVLVLQGPLLPAGMAMQAYGVTKFSSWPSIMNPVFSKPGASLNLLGAPAWFLAMKLFIAVFFTHEEWSRFRVGEAKLLVRK